MGKHQKIMTRVGTSVADCSWSRRGKSGGQVRDEYRDEYDPGRGGFGRAVEMERIKEEEEYGRGR